MEGEENKLTTFSTWTIMLGCNESNIIFQQHLCKLGQLQRSNSQVFGQAMPSCMPSCGSVISCCSFPGRRTFSSDPTRGRLLFTYIIYLAPGLGGQCSFTSAAAPADLVSKTSTAATASGFYPVQSSATLRHHGMWPLLKNSIVHHHRFE